MWKAEVLPPLMDQLVLENIFSNLDLFDLRSARLVCRLWASEGANSLRRHGDRGINIHLAPLRISKGMDYDGFFVQPDNDATTLQKLEQDRQHLLDFLTQNEVRHTLHISFLDFYSWKDNLYRWQEKDFFSVDEQNFEQRRKDTVGYYNQENNFQFVDKITFHFVPKIKHLVEELWIEMILMTEKDMEWLENILEILEGSVERIYLKLVRCNENLLRGKRNHENSVVKTLAVSR